MLPFGDILEQSERGGLEIAEFRTAEVFRAVQNACNSLYASHGQAVAEVESAKVVSLDAQHQPTQDLAVAPQIETSDTQTDLADVRATIAQESKPSHLLRSLTEESVQSNEFPSHEEYLRGLERAA